RTPAPRAVSGLGQSLRLCASVLYGTSAAREAAGRGTGASLAARLGHAGAARPRPGRIECPVAELLRARARARPARTNREIWPTLRPRARAGPERAGPPVRSLPSATRQGG